MEFLISAVKVFFFELSEIELLFVKLLDVFQFLLNDDFPLPFGFVDDYLVFEIDLFTLFLVLSALLFGTVDLVLHLDLELIFLSYFLLQSLNLLLLHQNLYFLLN